MENPRQTWSFIMRYSLEGVESSMQLKKLARRLLTTRVLRDYQEECIATCLTKLDNGVKRQAVSLPVGSGKTFIFTNMINRVSNPSPLATKTLILAHKTELLMQAYQSVKTCYPEMNIAFDQGIQRPNASTEVVIASVHAIGRVDGKRLASYNPHEYKLIIIDTYIRVLDHFRAFDPESKIFLWGCSATLRRNDKKKLSKVFSEISYFKPFLGMIYDGWLCNFKYRSVKTTTSLSGLKALEGDFKLDDLSERVNQEERNGLVVTAYKDMIQSSDYKSTVVFAADIEHVLTLTDLFNRNGIACAAIHSNLSTTQRQHNIRLFSEGILNVLVNCGILTEGVDIPRIDSIMITRPTKSTILLQQMLGRGLRLFLGKDHCLVIDFVDVIDRKHILATIPQLMGKDGEFDFEGVDALEIAEEVYHTKGTFNNERAETEAFEGPIEVQVVDHGFIIDLTQVTREDVMYQHDSPYKWIRTSPTELSMCVQKNRYLIISEENVVKFFMSTPDRRFFWKRVVLCKHNNITSAFTAASIWITEKFGPIATTLYRTASWRKEDPSTPQLTLLAKKLRSLVIMREVDGDYEAVTDGDFSSEEHFVMVKRNTVKPKPARLTRGMASDLILKSTLNGGYARSAFTMTRNEAVDALANLNVR